MDDSDKKLFTSVEGAAALVVLMPVIREVAQYIAGRAPCPFVVEDARLIFRDVPQIKLSLSIERAHYRWMKKEGLIRD